MEIEEGVIRRGRRPRRITPSKISRVTKTLTSLRVKNTFFPRRSTRGTQSLGLLSQFQKYFISQLLFYLFIFSLWEMNNGNSLVDFVYSDIERFFAIALFMFLWG